MDIKSLNSDKVRAKRYSSSLSLTSKPSTKGQFWFNIRKAFSRLDALGIESRGIERIAPEERSLNLLKQMLSVAGLWFSACCGLTAQSSFYLGSLTFGLGLRNALIAGIIGQTLGCMVAAYASMMGPRSGCRQMVTARYLFGRWFIMIVSLISILGELGWCVVNAVFGGQILSAISDGEIPIFVGILIGSIIALIVAVLGMKQVLRYETYMSVPIFVAFVLLYVVTSNNYDLLSNHNQSGLDSATIKGNFLSFFSLCYSSTATWAGMASDYYIMFPEGVPDIYIFWLTFATIFIPSTFVAVLGLLLGNITLNQSSLYQIYESSGPGGLVSKIFQRWNGGGKFLMVILFLSLISNTIVTTYSAVFNIQVSNFYFSKVPRCIWTLVVVIIYTVCALAGRNKFSTILSNFLPMLGYWISMYFMMLLEENFIFRTDRFAYLFTKEFPPESSNEDNYSKLGKEGHYNWNAWDNYSVITLGIASSLSFIIGAVGAVVGMSQVYWIGPVARKVGGEYGADIGMWLVMAFSGIVYPFFRYFELKKFGR